MVTNDESTCPECGGTLKQRGHVKRIVRTKGGNTHWIKIRRLVCNECGKEHRELPDCLLPYKHYEAEIIKGVISGIITSDDLDYEDYPCEMTMKRWRESQK